jgi:hypothetical protein
MSRAFTSNFREVPHDHEEPVPVVEVEARTARFLPYDAKLVEELPDADVDYSVTARVEKCQDSRRHWDRDTLQRAQEL